MQEAGIPGRTVGQPNPPQPAGYNPPATPGPTDHAPPTYAPVDSSGGWMPNGPIPRVVYAAIPVDVASPGGVDGYTAPGWQTGPPDQGLGVIVTPAQQAPPNTQPGLGAPSAGYAASIPLTPVQAINAPDLWLQTNVATPVQAPRNVAASATALAGTNPPQVAMAASRSLPYVAVRPIVLQLGPLTSDTLICGGAGRIVYVAVRESTGGAAATFSLVDGTPAGGQVIVPYSLLAGQSARDNFYPHGIPYTGDLWYDLDTGSLTGSVYVVPEDLWADFSRTAERLERSSVLQAWSN